MAADRLYVLGFAQAEPWGADWFFWLILVFILVAFIVASYQGWRIERRSQNARLAKVIAEQQRVEDELRASEALFRTAFESSAIGIGLLSLDGNILAANAAVCAISGYSEAELKQRNDRQNVYPPDQEIGQHLHSEMLAGQRDSYTVERRYVRKSGQIFWARLTISLVRDADGAPDYLIGMLEDIDEPKRKSAALAESEARFRAMYNNAAVGIAMMSLERRVISVNETSARITGYSIPELLSINPVQLSHPADAEIGAPEFRALAAGKLSEFQMEKRMLRKSGECFWARITYSAVPDQDGKPEYVLGLLEDITEEKQARKAIAESEERFRILFNQAGIGIVLVDLGEYNQFPLDEEHFLQLVANQRLNPAMLHMFGYNAEELQHIPIANLIYPDDLGIDAKQFRQLLNGELDSYRIEKRFVRKDGSVFWGRLTDSLARTAEGKPRMVIGIIEDINEERLAKMHLASQQAESRRELEARIAARTAELNLANEQLRVKATQDAVTAERTRLARELHDAVTQTLFSTTLIADVLPEIWDMDRAEGQRRLEELRQMTRGALAEMRTLLVELRPNALVEVPLPTLLRQLTEAMAGRARIAITYHVEGQSQLPSDVQIGFYRIAQEALNNLVKHAKASQAVVSLRLDDAARLTIADNGVGFEIANVTAEHLGLKIMRERAEALGARLSIYSAPGEGTQISVTWPEIARPV
ncbi:MAG: PAS domain S-box protein [Anaerolineales bacterium]|nr:PAS domain S-box protein [Anaerolineales bacterium]